MDEQQFQVYIPLIKQILSCAEGEEVAILQQQPDLVNEGLLMVMQAYADWLEQQGNPNAGGWLRQFAQRWATAIEDTNTQTEGILEGSDQQFLLKVLQLIVDNQGDAQHIYPFLEQHQDKLNPSLLQALPQIALGLMASEPEQREFVAFNFYVFGNLINQFPLGQRRLNLELGIAAYRQALTVVTEAEMPTAWAETMNSLAIAYANRVEGDRAENIEQAIAFHQQALTVITQAKMPATWAITANNLALTYTNRIRGDQAENIEQAIALHQQVLTVRTPTEMPADWAITMLNLAVAYLKRIRGNRTENVEQAIDACQKALTVQTPMKMPFDWALTMHNLASAYLNRIGGDRAENIEQAITAFQQALTVRTQISMPIEWAQTMNEMAKAYHDRIQGDRAENVEQAIECYQQALIVRTQMSMPADWAQTIDSLAVAYANRIRGGRAENIEQAIVFYQQALTVMTREVMPIAWASTISNLALTYSKRIQGDRAENFEQAITFCEQALTVRTQTAMPVEWAQTTKNLAIAYADRIRGNRAENIEQAIARHRQALTVRTQITMPVEWAETMSELAIAYSKRIQGDRTENLEQAIAFYQQALTVRTQTAMPVEWAQTTMNLAVTYVERIQGDRTENLEQAIAFYQQALTVRTQTAMPVEWATTMSNLGAAYLHRLRGNRGENVEQAIGAYKESLTVRTQITMPVEWAQTMMNLSVVYFESLQGDLTNNIEQAIILCRQALTVITQTAMPFDWSIIMMNLGSAYSERIQADLEDNLEQAIKFYQQALTVMTKTAMPVDWAFTMNNLATAYYKRISGNLPYGCTQPKRAKNIEQAINAFQSCLEVFQPELFPNDCRRASGGLGKLYSDLHCWQEASLTYQKALQASKILYEGANLLDSKVSELKATGNLPREAAYAFARNNNLPAAVLTLEQSRARGLSETLKRDQSDLSRLQQTHPALFNQYQDITAQLRNLEAQQRLRMTSEERHSLTPADFRTEAQRLRQTLAATVEQIRQVEGYADFLAQPDLNDIQQAIRPDIPLVYLIPTRWGSLALIVTQTGIADLWLDELSETDLIDLLDNTWISAYSQSRTNPQGWLEAIDHVTRQLWKPLMAPLIDHLKRCSFQQATLIPTGYLSLLPIHAAWTEDVTTATGKRYALDEICFTYAPNAQSMNVAAAIAQRTGADSILAIDDPSHGLLNISSLPNSEREINCAIATFFQPNILRHESATISAVKDGLVGAAIAHFACHGTANLEEPLNSGLLMSDGLLTLRDILDLKLSNQGGIRLAVLSACETGLPGTKLVDEAISLPTGLLQAGVAGVVASLWSVSDLSTMLLLIRFYDYWRKESLEPAAALHQAQLWIRNTTSQQKAKYFKETDVGIFHSLILLAPDYFTHPFHWAAFSYVGV